MRRKVSVKCAIAGCHYQLKLTLAEREELRRVGRENNAPAGLVCPAHVKAAFNFEFDDIDIDVPLEELLVEASKETPRWRVMLTPLPGGQASRTAIPHQRRETGSFSSHVAASLSVSHPPSSTRTPPLNRMVSSKNPSIRSCGRCSWRTGWSSSASSKWTRPRSSLSFPRTTGPARLIVGYQLSGESVSAKCPGKMPVSKLGERFL